LPKADAFRRPLPQGPKGAGEFRIVALGDSFTWGYGVEDAEDVWPGVLETLLGEGRFTVVNLGVPGFTTVNELEMFARVGAPLDPDLVIVQYLVNDVLPSGIGYRRHGEEWLDERRPAELLPLRDLHLALEKRSALYAFANHRFAALQRRIRPPRGWEELYEDDFPGWRDMKKALAAMAVLAEKQGSRAVLVLFPSFLPGEWHRGGHPYAEIHEKVSAAAGEAGLEVLDLLPHFTAARRPLEEWWVGSSDPHPGPEAHAFAAEVTAAFLRKKGLVRE